MLTLLSMTKNLHLNDIAGKSEPLSKYLHFYDKAITGLGIKTASYRRFCKQMPPSWIKKCMFLFITCYVGKRWYQDIYILTRYTIFCFIWCIYLTKQFCKTNAIANWKFESGEILRKKYGDDAVHIAIFLVLSVFTFIYKFLRLT